MDPEATLLNMLQGNHHSTSDVRLPIVSPNGEATKGRWDNSMRCAPCPGCTLERAHMEMKVSPMEARPMPVVFHPAGTRNRQAMEWRMPPVSS
jgi:hypothetical protein